MSTPDEAAYLESYESTAFPKPSVAVDVVLLAIQADALSALLVRRSEHPDLGRWALPGGFVRLDEHLDDAAARVLRTKAGVENVYLEQLYTFGRPDRDPRMRILSVAYYALADVALLERVPAGDDTRFHTIRVPWIGDAGGAVDLFGDRGDPVDTAFDHREIIGTAVKRLRGKLNYTPVGYALLPAQFTLLQLQRVHEIILGSRVNKDSFRRRMLASGELEQTGEMQDGVDHRPAALYRRVHQGGSHG
ncbi:MAG TPA: NUDIX domain-containing protein [Xanthomonadales bacterium]|nr:NUDIX domain-containing protein [Xanthomonadales bacterium]